jgi:hypothetical protein
VEYVYKGGNIDEKYDTLGILSCWDSYSLLDIFPLLRPSFLAIPSFYRLEILPFGPKGLFLLSLLGFGGHVCRRIPIF